MLDRAHQALVKLALEPEWEARFEPNSYGFRPGRSAHDAIEAIFSSICFQPKYVLDADIAGCFNHIAHAPLLAALQTFPTMRHTIRAWLKAGVLESGVLTPTQAGTPQGGVISPLLANIALHGMEDAVRAESTPASTTGQSARYPKLIRYADDLVVLSPTRAGIEQAQTLLTSWLAIRGLALKPSKTRIVHTLEAVNGEAPGFDFLGFNVRQYPVGRSHAGRHNGHRLGFKTLIRPSQEAVRRHRATLRQQVRQGRALAQVALIGHLNPIIRGWTLYFRTVAAKTTFQDCDSALFPLLLRWARRRHPKQNATWVARRYWQTVGRAHWRFATPDGIRLTQHAGTVIRRHVKVQGTASPFDGNLVYWATRLQHHPVTNGTLGKLLARQHGRCGICRLTFRDDDDIEIDHILPQSLGGTDVLTNLMALHRHCHDQRHAAHAVGGIPVKNPTAEELDEEKVLTSSSGGGRAGAIPLA